MSRGYVAMSHGYVAVSRGYVAVSRGCVAVSHGYDYNLPGKQKVPGLNPGGAA